MTSNPPAASTTVGAYLATRLHQLGVDHVFGLPGDFNLSLIDEMLTVDALTWVGTANELNGAYAADGYARIRRGIAAIVTTYGVGELSAINGIAGSFAEGVPVAHIVGMPSTAAQHEGRILHHTLGDGDFGHFVRASAEVTEASVVLRATDGAQQIDEAILRALKTSRPVYIGVPADVAVAPAPTRPLARPLSAGGSDPEQLAAFAQSLHDAIGQTADVTMLAGPLLHRRRLEPVIARIAAHPGVRIATQIASKALLDESHPAYAGVYAGALTDSAAGRREVDEAAPLILAGVVMSDFLTGFFTHGFDDEASIAFALDRARVGGEVFYDVRLEDALATLDDLLASRGTRQAAAARSAEPDSAHAADPAAPLDHAVFWPRLEAWLRPGTTLIAEAGTAFYGAVGLHLPDDCELLGQPIWSSIGYTLPALLGAMLAAPDRTAVLVIGDGSAQLTIQELGTFFRHGLAPTILLLDNDGYTVERLIRSPEAPYQDVAAWDWTALPAAFGSPQTLAVRVETVAELEDALAQARTAPAGALIQVVLPRDDSPELLTRIAGAIR